MIKSMKRVSLFVGHYGSGKTNIAVNAAFRLREKGLAVTVADMDIVNPYFRTKDSEEEFKRRGIGFISSPFANSNLDAPALPSELYGVFERRDACAVVDVGGDERGALALGRFVPLIKAENNYECFFVVNMYRPLTRTPEEALEVLREIENASHIKATAIINNSNIGAETTTGDILASAEYVSRLEKMSGLPLAFTSLDSRLKWEKTEIKNPLPLMLQSKLGL